MKDFYRRGEIYYAELEEGVGSEQQGRRPVVIVSNDLGNRHSPTVLIAPLTSHTSRRDNIPTHYPLAVECGLDRPSVILAEQLDTYDKHRLGRYVGRLEPRHLRGMNRALAVSLGLIEPKPNDMTVCLCSSCANNFYGTGNYYLKRIHYSGKDLCTYCNHRPGYSYQVVTRRR